MGNYINVSYSLALRHQLYQCYLDLNRATIGVDLEVGPVGYNLALLVLIICNRRHRGSSSPQETRWKYHAISIYCNYVRIYKKLL